jgi:predicted nucleic acid-binding protein
MAFLIDSSVSIGLERRGLPPESVIAALPDEVLAISAVTASELLIGVHRADTPARRLQRESYVETVLAVFSLVRFDLFVARTHAALGAQLMMGGPVHRCTRPAYRRHRHSPRLRRDDRERAGLWFGAGPDGQAADVVTS